VSIKPFILRTALVLLGLRNISAPSLVYSIPGILLPSAYLTIPFPLRCRVTNRRQATATQGHYPRRYHDPEYVQTLIIMLMFNKL